jgi:hypothetical protein
MEQRDEDPFAVQKAKLSSTNSPWSVTSIFEFQFYCCPECDTKYQQKQNFVNHAYSNHPKAFEHMSAIHDESLSDINLPWSVDIIDNVKFEIADETSQSPWSVKSIHEFQLYCCPECNTRCQQNQTFVNHAYCNHSEAVELLSAIQDQSLSDINVPWSVDIIDNIKEEDESSETDVTKDISVEEVGTEEPKPKKAKHEFDPTISKTINREVQCYFCSQMILLANIGSHIENKHVLITSTSKMYGQPRPLQCKVCKAAFETQSNLDWHICYFDKMKTLVRNANGNYQCSECCIEATRFQLLRRHFISVHITERPFQCEYCFFKTKTAPQLTQHVKGVHHDKKQKQKQKSVEEEDNHRNANGMYACSDCSLEWTDEHSCKCHFIDKHTTEKPFKCDFKTKTARRLTIHSYVNECLSEVQCYYCSDMVTVTDIEPHITAEHGSFNTKMYGPPRDYQCRVCKGAFATQSNLDWHVCFLTNLKPVRSANGMYQCSACSKEWKDGSTFRRHFLCVHTKERPFHCEHCDFKTKIAPELSRHIKKIHNKTIQYSELTMARRNSLAKEAIVDEDVDNLTKPKSLEGVYILSEENEPNSAEISNDLMEDKEILRNDIDHNFKEPKNDEEQLKMEKQMSGAKVDAVEENKPFLEWLNRIVKTNHAPTLTEQVKKEYA